jgi:hypothetical protein
LLSVDQLADKNELIHVHSRVKAASVPVAWLRSICALMGQRFSRVLEAHGRASYSDETKDKLASQCVAHNSSHEAKHCKASVEHLCSFVMRHCVSSVVGDLGLFSPDIFRHQLFVVFLLDKKKARLPASTKHLDYRAALTPPTFRSGSHRGSLTAEATNEVRRYVFALTKQASQRDPQAIESIQPQ